MIEILLVEGLQLVQRWRFRHAKTFLALPFLHNRLQSSVLLIRLNPYMTMWYMWCSTIWIWLRKMATSSLIIITYNQNNILYYLWQFYEHYAKVLSYLWIGVGIDSDNRDREWNVANHKALIHTEVIGLIMFMTKDESLP